MAKAAPPEELVAFCAAQLPRVLGSLRLLVRDEALAQDLCQETFLRVCRDWDRLREMEASGAWVHRVAVNLAMSAHRRRGAERRATARLAPIVAVPEPDGPGPDERRAVIDALAQLDDRLRAVVVLRYFAQLSVREVGEVLGMPEGTVKTCTRRALERLRATELITEVAVDD